MSTASSRKGAATPLAPRPTFVSATTGGGVVVGGATNVGGVASGGGGTGMPMLRPLAPTGAALPMPPATTVDAANGSVVPATASGTITLVATQSTGVNTNANQTAATHAGVIAAAATTATPPPTTLAPIDEKPSVPGRRQFTWEDENLLVELWKRYISEYFNGVRKRVLEKMTDELNHKLPAPPHFTVKQVNNKLHYMERRYRSLLEEFRNGGIPITQPGIPVSTRASVERKFSLFYVVHEVLEEVVTTPEGSSRVVGAPSVSMPSALTASGSANADSANGSTAPAATTTTGITLPEPAPVHPLADTVLEGVDVDLPVPIALTPPADAHTNNPVPPAVAAEPTASSTPAVGVVESLMKRAAPESAAGGSSPKRARVGVALDAESSAVPGNSRAGDESVVGRITQLVKRMVSVAERVVDAERAEREERAAAAQRAHEVRLRELELLDNQTQARLQESRAALHKQKVDTLRFVASQRTDMAERARALRALEDLSVLDETAATAAASGGAGGNGNSESAVAGSGE